MGKMKSLFGVYGVGLLLVLAGFLVAYQFVEPSPPHTITIVSGSEKGAYYQYAQDYARILKRDGITLNVMATAGSSYNIVQLAEGSVDVGLVQGGITSPNPEVRSLGSLYYEPVWIFQRKGLDLKYMRDFKGRNINIGVSGSGTNTLARALLDLNGVNDSTARLVEDSAEKSLPALVSGQLDILFIVASPDADLVRTLLADTRVDLMTIRRAEAYTRVLPYLTQISLPAGVVNMAQNIPSEDVTLLSTTANLVVRPGLHPALVGLLMQAITEVHGGHSLFNRAGVFPSARYLGFPLHDSAAHFYKYGPPFLQRFLPFWAANLVDRLKIMLLPLFGLLFPVFKIMPPFYRWRVRRRIFRWYSELRQVDPEATTLNHEEIRQYRKELDRIENEVARVEVPLSYADELYHLRLHIEMVRGKLDRFAISGSE